MKSKHTNLLQFEDVLVEVVLQPLVGKVDAELLKAVVLVILEAEDVQHSDGQELRSKTRRRRKNNKGLEYFFFFEKLNIISHHKMNYGYIYSSLHHFLSDPAA